MDLEDARELGLKILAENDLHNWTFGFDRAKTRFGYCCFSHNEITLSSILTELNAYLLVLDTILHEVAHALVGNDEGHGPLWRAKAIELGAEPTVCFAANTVVLPPRDWTGTCPSCESTLQRHRRDYALICLDCDSNFKWHKEVNCV